jgi:F-type H+-transporting ATPase subunit b
MEHFPTVWAIVLQILGFAILYWLLSRFFFGPIGRMLVEREELVKGRVAESEKNRRAMISARENYEKRLSLIESEAREKIQGALKEAHRARDEILSTARKSAEDIESKGRAQVEREREKAMVEVRDQVVDMAVLAASKIIEKNLDAASHRAMIDDILNEVKM